MLDFSRLKTPPCDGDVLIEPSAKHLVGLAESNHAVLDTYDFAVLDRNVGDLRRGLRRTLCAACDGPIILTGHQPDFIHAGVWAKHVVASRLASAFGGKAVNFVVDSDAPSNTVLEVPTATESGHIVKSVRYARMAHGVPHECIARLDSAESRSFENAVRELLGSHYRPSRMPDYFDAMSAAADARDWVDQMVAARRSVERAFGVEMIEHRVSRVWFGPFLGDLLVNAPRFRECYNRALADYRSLNRVRNPNRPIPDLAVEGRRCELPVWVYRPGGARRRLFVAVEGDRLSLYADAELFGEASVTRVRTWDGASAVLEDMDGYVFRPRALSLTAWARVFVGDLFIHGIGGAKYDRITDGLIRRYYGVEPPAMACVSATLLMDLPHDGADESMLRAAEQRVRDVRYNPQRHVARTQQTESLIARRHRAVELSGELGTRARRDRVRRGDTFREIRAINDDLNAADPSVAAVARRHACDVAHRLVENHIARRRDYFFAMLDGSRLARLHDRLASAVDNAV